MYIWISLTLNCRKSAQPKAKLEDEVELEGEVAVHRSVVLKR